MDSIFTQLSEIYGYLNGAQRTIANFVQRCPEAVAATQEQPELAELIGVEEREVLRFVQSLGYLDFAQFEADLRQSIALGERPRQVAQSEVSEAVFAQSAQNLERTRQMLYPQELERAVTWMEQARHLYLLGLRSSFTLAYYLHTRLSQIRREVRLIHTTGMEYPEELAGIAPGDVMVAFLFPNYTKITANLIVLARSRGAKVILIADENHTVLEGYADLLLPCFVRGTGEKISLSAPLALSEALAEELAARNPEQSSLCAQEAAELLRKSYELGL